MSEENNEKRTVKSTLNRKFGVSEATDRRNPRADGERGERKSFGDRKPFGDRGDRPFRGDRKPFGDRMGRRDDRPFREDRFRGDRDERREGEGFNREGGERSDRPFNRDRRPRSFGDRPFRGDRKPFGGDRRPRREFAQAGAPVYRQRPEEQQVENVEEVLDETALEARVAQVEANEDVTSNPPWFKKLLALTTEKGREREGRFIGEGIHVVHELVSHHRELVLGVYAVEGFEDETLMEAINEAEIRVNVLTEAQMKQLSSTVATQGVIAVARIASKKPAYESSRSILTLVDAVQDPGNLGTLFRTSLGFNSAGMILGRGTVSPFNPKVVRGSSGTFLRVPFEFDVDLIDQINFLRSKGYTIIATDLHAKQSLREIPAHKLRKMAFLVGNEGAGTNPYFIELADETVKIPMSSELESLNVAVAHGILSYEAALIQDELK
ncbi:RNA methyltransferase [Fibrobacter sp. UWEL]|uniref:TrmH family RNA methyltransferase n=1 Tax=Fibrobacter sp. UWEL TaxID=1896209 RepID=UPI00091587FB|nr:RNA methyltransferase [Fibrobacter sp. UWEL]SHK75831.1 RNA methyltransferase, TrmH family [Fibrobacter sp. UWEL]